MADQIATAQNQPEQALNSASNTPTDHLQTCSFFEKLPLEVRNEIYKLLLVNCMLGQSDLDYYAIDEDGSRVVKYGLSISILSTCRQAYNEASKILYECNTFYIYCMGNHGYEYRVYNQSFNSICPIMRWDYSPHPRNLSTLPTLAKVKHWKILVNSYKVFPEQYPCQTLISFCKSIHHSLPFTLDVLLIPAGIQEQPGTSFEDPEVVLRPLTLLRRLREGTFSVRDASFEEVHESQTSHSHVATITSQLPSASSLHSLIQLGTSHEPVDIASEMYPGLLRYAQSFERYIPFKLAMDLPMTEEFTSTPGKRCRRGYPERNLPNPFRDTSFAFLEKSHPLEVALSLAKKASESQDIDRFKFYRGQILDYLEPQYQRVMSASSIVVDFIKDHKHTGALFDAEGVTCMCAEVGWGQAESHYLCQDVVAEAAVLLDHYTSSFQRDMPFQIQVNFKKQQKLFSGFYFQRDREGALADLNRLIEMGACDDFVSAFRCAFDHMETQRREIRDARKGLFAFDFVNDRQTEIDPEPNRCDDFVDFSVNEPICGVDPPHPQEQW
ncbi:hypothetical protein V8E51_014027 [Hyaloscypha variabilis]